MTADDRPVRRAFVLPRQREAAAAHFRRLERWSPAGDEPRPSVADDTESTIAGPTPTTCRFEIYRSDEVRVTATRLSGGDWHWRLSDPLGTCLVDAGGYRTEGDCRQAVILLKSEAALAALPGCER